MIISEFEKTFMKKWFAIRTNQEMVEMLGCSHSRLHRMARALHLRKDTDHLSSWYRQHNFELNMLNRRKKYEAQRIAQLGKIPGNKKYFRPDNFDEIVIRYRSQSTAKELATEYNVPRYIMCNWLAAAGVSKSEDEKKRLRISNAKKMGERNSLLHTNNRKKTNRCNKISISLRK